MKNDNIKNQYRINEQIRSREVRIVGDNGSTVVPTRQALDMARDQGVDLVEISPNANPPVCRLIDYSKFLYQQKKRAKEMKAKQVKVEVKEIRFGPQTDEHDYQFKLKHAKEFLEDGNKVRAYVFFRGRSILFKEQGEVLLLRFANDLEEYGKVEHMPSLEGKKMFLYLAPKKAGVAKKSQQALDREKKATEQKEAVKEAKKSQSAEEEQADMLKNKCIVIGVTGSIAAYKAAELTSWAKKQHADVNVIMTKNALYFINPITFETLAGTKCLTDTFDRNFQYNVEHVELASLSKF